jgi:ketosteroid isomerase-like protein
MDIKQTDVRQTITQLYRDYESRNLNKVLDGLPEDFCFEWPFDPSTARYSGICHGKAELVEQLEDIAANFQFNAYRPLNILVDGDSAAAQLQLDLTSEKTGRRFSMRIAHFWTFKEGVPIHLVEYTDTALIASESGPPSEAHGDSSRRG